MSKIVLALGGNALGKTPREQLALVRDTAKSLVEVILAGHQLVIVHGNGPQVGMINLAMEYAALHGGGTPPMPFPECGAMSQGYIGYHIQNALTNALGKKKLDIPVTSLVSQVLVDENDPAFQKPSKPIGAFYQAAEARQLMKDRSFVMEEEAGRGWRRLIASPRPIEIIEARSILSLASLGHIVIAAGGGGIPVIRFRGELQGVPAVIDKDFTANTLAQALDADCLCILTAVDAVALDFAQENERNLSNIKAAELQGYLAAGFFALGSMRPKVEAAVLFVKSKPSRKAIIANLRNAAAALREESGTIITG